VNNGVWDENSRSCGSGNRVKPPGISLENRGCRSAWNGSFGSQALQRLDLHGHILVSVIRPDDEVLVADLVEEPVEVIGFLGGDVVIALFE
jgi:hypothetical protein